ncbi:MAG: hypothetical protein AB7F35_06550 [Acetobacteraceae bacterium]
MTAQLDLFGFADPPPAVVAARPTPPTPPAAPRLLPRPATVEWARLLTTSGIGDVAHTMVMVTCLWGGVVVECLRRGPSHSQQLLTVDGKLMEVGPDSGTPGRIVYLEPAAAIELHARHPLIWIGVGGTHSRIYRFAQDGEETPAELPLPPAAAP